MNVIKYRLEGDDRNKNSPYREISREEFVALNTFDSVEFYCYNNQFTSLPGLPFVKNFTVLKVRICLV